MLLRLAAYQRTPALILPAEPFPLPARPPLPETTDADAARDLPSQTASSDRQALLDAAAPKVRAPWLVVPHMHVPCLCNQGRCIVQLKCGIRRTPKTDACLPKLQYGIAMQGFG